MSSVQKAGAIVLRPGSQEPEVLLMFRGQFEDWSFPKGHCEPGETSSQTAIRETQEETGIDIEIVKQLPDMLYSNAFEGAIVVAMYLAAPRDAQQALQLERSGDQVEWVPLSQVADRLSYQNLKDYLESVKQNVFELSKKF